MQVSANELLDIFRGCGVHGGTFNLFRKSGDLTYSRMWREFITGVSCRQQVLNWIQSTIRNFSAFSRQTFAVRSLRIWGLSISMRHSGATTKSLARCRDPGVLQTGMPRSWQHAAVTPSRTIAYRGVGGRSAGAGLCADCTAADGGRITQLRISLVLGRHMSVYVYLSGPRIFVF